MPGIYLHMISLQWHCEMYKDCPVLCISLYGKTPPKPCEMDQFLCHESFCQNTFRLNSSPMVPGWQYSKLIYMFSTIWRKSFKQNYLYINWSFLFIYYKSAWKSIGPFSSELFKIYLIGVKKPFIVFLSRGWFRLLVRGKSPICWQLLWYLRLEGGWIFIRYHSHCILERDSDYR